MARIDAAQTRPRALITGASSGIGQAFAERLAHDGYDLIVVARRRDRLESLALRLNEGEGARVDVLPGDLTQPDDLRAVEERVAGDKALAMLVNNAGFAGYMPFIDLSPDRAEELVQLLIVATIRLTRAALPGMIARQKGAIINVSSLLAFSAGVPASAPPPQRAVYAASKAFLNAFTELLQTELEGSGVQVQALCPGLVGPTEFHELAGMDRSRFPPTWVMTPEAVVQASLIGLKLGEVVCVPSLDDLSTLTQDRDKAGRTTYPQGGLFAGPMRGALAERYTRSDSGGD